MVIKVGDLWWVEAEDGFLEGPFTSEDQAVKEKLKSA